MKLNFQKYLIFFIFINLKIASSFVPAKLINSGINKVNQYVNFESVGLTLTHEEIIKRGIIRSVVNYFYEKSNKSSRIDLNKTNTDYLNLKNLYFDYYGIWYCKINLENLIRNEFQKNVAIVDFDKDTKDLPYAHFDAETFQKSNDRVIQFKNDIYNALYLNKYKKARKLIGEVLHTIHDFYSHSNWIEMGHNDINYHIGTLEFFNSKNNKTFINRNDNLTCNNNCNVTTVHCNIFVGLFVKFLKSNNLISFNIDCPLKYYSCRDNILAKNKLLSGYYGEQELNDGSTYEKPDNLIKCSHGGIMDTSSLADAIGGINKDSGYYMFSPHAYLHLKAANLAIKHTAYFFDQIRSRIGNYEFEKFLHLNQNYDLFNRFNKLLFQKCYVTNSEHCSVKKSKLKYFLNFWLLNFHNIYIIKNYSLNFYFSLAFSIVLFIK